MALKNTKDYFLSAYLAKQNNAIEVVKINSVFWSSLFIGVFLIFYLPALNGLSPTVTKLGAFTSLLCFSNLFILKKYENYKLPGKLYFSTFLIFILLIQFVTQPENIATYVVWSIVLLVQVAFILGKGASFLFLMGITTGLGITAYLKANHIDFGQILGIESFTDTSQVNYTTPLKIGVPLSLFLIILHQFIDNHFEINQNLIGSIKEKDEINYQLETSEARYRHIVDGADDFVFEIDKDGNIKFMNISFQKQFKNPKLKEINLLDLVPNNYVDEVMKEFQLLIDKKRKFSHNQFPLIDRKGNEIWTGQKAILIYNEKNEFEKALCIARDITSSIKINQKLKEAKESAEKAAMAKTKFLSAMSHEIRTPMNAIMGVTSLLANDNLTKEQQEHIETLKFSSDSMLSLVRDILDFNNLDNGNLKLSMKTFEPSQLIRTTVMGVSPIVDDKGLTFSTKIDSKIPLKLIGDKERLSQILNILLQNAVKYTNKGTVTLSIALAAETPTTTTVNFSVKDTGIGISSDKLEHVFEAFSQANESTIRQGTGLGLAIIQKLLTLFKSEINVESEVGKGSEFSFEITFQKDGEVKLNKPKPLNKMMVLETSELKGRRVLVVEDNLINQKITVKILSKWGVEADIAENGKIGFEMVQQSPYDFVLMDLQMPVMNGIESTKAIRNLGGEFENIPIIALTASAVLEVKTQALEAGLDAFITKPFSPDFLYDELVKHTIVLKKITPK